MNVKNQYLRARKAIDRDCKSKKSLSDKTQELLDRYEKENPKIIMAGKLTYYLFLSNADKYKVCYIEAKNSLNSESGGFINQYDRPSIY